MCKKVKIISTANSWLEGNAIEQLKKVSELEQVVYSVGLPDLHAGKGAPIGACFVSKKRIYPYLAGSDIGCGMRFLDLKINIKKIKIKQWIKKLEKFEKIDLESVDEEKKTHNITLSNYDSSLGTIGGGNHFAEILQMHEVLDQQKINQYNIDISSIFLLIHSGSRSLGEAIFKDTVLNNTNHYLEESSEAFDEYLSRHNEALSWAELNRKLIAKKVDIALNLKSELILDIFHNSILKENFKNEQYWFHRKGAASSRDALIVIPGSRGSLSYLVEANQGIDISAFSLAHGAGRKWKRSDSQTKLKKKYSHVSQLKKTALGSYVICSKKELLYEEAPENYKDIDQVIDDLIKFKLVKPIAKFKPLISYKTN